MTLSPYFVVILVAAPHLDYSGAATLAKTIAKHPADGSKNGTVGHAWIYLEGDIHGKRFCFEGGHSGELGLNEERYFEKIVNNQRIDANPIRFLHDTLTDGFLQHGNGGHLPTFAAKIDLSEKQFHDICNFIRNYSFVQYNLMEKQCTAFASQIASIAGLPLCCGITIQTEPILKYRREAIRLWSDPAYSSLTLLSPDCLEKSLIDAVRQGRAQNGLSWYLKRLVP